MTQTTLVYSSSICRCNERFSSSSKWMSPYHLRNVITVLFNVIQDRICSIKNQSLWSVILKSQLIDWVVCFSMFSLYSALNVIVWFAVLNDQSLHSFYTLPSSAIDVWTFTVNASKTQTHEVLMSLSMLLFVFHSRQQLVLAC